MTRIDPKGRHFTESESSVRGVRTFRRMTDEEVERYNASKSGGTRVQPTDIKPPEPTPT